MPVCLFAFTRLKSTMTKPDNLFSQSLVIGKAARSALKGQDTLCIWFTGLSGSGKSTLANLLDRRLHDLLREARELPERGTFGQALPGSVVDLNGRGVPVVQVLEPAVVAAAEGAAQLGDRVTVRVVGADVAAGRVMLRIESAGAAESPGEA